MALRQCLASPILHEDSLEEVPTAQPDQKRMDETSNLKER